MNKQLLLDALAKLETREYVTDLVEQVVKERYNMARSMAMNLMMGLSDKARLEEKIVPLTVEPPKEKKK